MCLEPWLNKRTKLNLLLYFIVFLGSGTHQAYAKIHKSQNGDEK